MNNIKVFVLLAVMTALFGVVGGAIGGKIGMLIALVARPISLNHHFGNITSSFMTVQ